MTGKEQTVFVETIFKPEAFSLTTASNNASGDIDCPLKISLSSHGIKMSLNIVIISQVN